jgi:serine/threonine-protein kinase
VEHIPDTQALAAAVPLAQGVAFVAAGGFKAMYRAVVDGRPEAVKAVYLPPDVDDSADERAQLLARLTREIGILRESASPFVVKLGRISPTQVTVAGHQYLVYSEELLPGRSVRDEIRFASRPGMDDLQALAVALVSVVRDLAVGGHIHRDIKPDNVIKTGLPARPFVVLDLGIAFKVAGTQLTGKGGPPGTPLYMAPELFNPEYKQVLDYRSDLYSAGITLYEYAAGKHPLARRDEDLYTTLYRILRQRPAALASHRPDLPGTLCHIVDRCIRKQPALRYSDLGALLASLEAIR